MYLAYLLHNMVQSTISQRDVFGISAVAFYLAENNEFCICTGVGYDIP
jgi:hypothetical protein